MMKKIANQALGRPSIEEYQRLDKISVTIILDGVRSLHNVGSFFRTADAFAVERIVLCGITATPPNKEIHKTALGAEESVAWSYRESAEVAATELSDQGYTVVAVEQVEGAVELQDFVCDAQRRYALIFGNEVHGVSQEALAVCDGAIEIPQFGTKHSLNVAVSGGVVLWHFFSKLSISKKTN